MEIIKINPAKGRYWFTGNNNKISILSTMISPYISYKENPHYGHCINFYNIKMRQGTVIMLENSDILKVLVKKLSEISEITCFLFDSHFEFSCSDPCYIQFKIRGHSGSTEIFVYRALK